MFDLLAFMLAWKAIFKVICLSLVVQAFFHITNALAQSANLPPGIQAEIKRAQSSCVPKHSVLNSGFIVRRDINGDGVDDYVLDYGKFDCDGNTTTFCGSAGCLTQVFVSLPDGSYRKVLNENILNIKFQTIKGRPAMIVDLHGTACGRIGVAPCSMRLIWNGAQFNPANEHAAEQGGLCLDGFCIEQSIQNGRFDQVQWQLPKDNLQIDKCLRVGCKPENAFFGYSTDDQQKLAAGLTKRFGLNQYTIFTNGDLAALRLYHYECDPSARGTLGERRFMGVYRSSPSNYLTVVGLRLIEGDLKIYRIAREYPYHNLNELRELAQKLRDQYGNQVLLYDYLSSNAYSDVITQNKNGWFARSTMFTPTDLANNAAELVLIDSRTRRLLLPTSMPESGDIKALQATIPQQCSRSMPLQ